MSVGRYLAPPSVTGAALSFGVEIYYEPSKAKKLQQLNGPFQFLSGGIAVDIEAGSGWQKMTRDSSAPWGELHLGISILLRLGRGSGPLVWMALAVFICGDTIEASSVPWPICAEMRQGKEPVLAIRTRREHQLHEIWDALIAAGATPIGPPPGDLSLMTGRLSWADCGR